MNVIFDVDGTLVQSYRLDSECFVAAVRDVLGDVRVHPDWSNYAHVTDAGILDQICAENGADPALVGAVRSRFAARVRAHLADDPGDCQEVAGARDTLAALARRSDVRIGVATGGWSVTAQAKLAHAGIAIPEGSLFSCDLSEERIEIMRACHAATGDPARPTVYVGDGEWDMSATITLGWNFVGIGARLRGKCDRWAEDFAGPAFAGHVRQISGGALRQ